MFFIVFFFHGQIKEKNIFLWKIGISKIELLYLLINYTINFRFIIRFEICVKLVYNYNASGTISKSNNHGGGGGATLIVIAYIQIQTDFYEKKIAQNCFNLDVSI